MEGQSAMAIYKRGKVYWYKFVFNGTRYRESAKTGNERAGVYYGHESPRLEGCG
jgi:hypothetical protein